MKALDLFCGAGGAGMGLHRAGFEVTGVDINPQPRYPFEFIQADALTFPLEGYDLIWASPPCQFGSALTAEHAKSRHPNLIPRTRERLHGMGTPYIIENVGGTRAHLINPIMLCGTMFGLGVRRHRYFEAPCLGLLLTPPCRHIGLVEWDGQQGRNKNPRKPWRGASVELEVRQRAMGIDWMPLDSLVLAIPPAYSEFLGRQVIEQIRSVAA